MVGAGPKGLHAIAALLRGSWRGKDLRVDCFDANPPGQGAAYACGQPDWLRLNVHPRVLHLPPHPPLDEWLAARGTDPSGDVPRHEVGRYLRAAADGLRREAGETLAFHPHAVRALERRGDAWLVRHDGGSVLADEVLLATGHAPDHDHALRHAWRPTPGVRMVPGVYPVADSLSQAQVPAGSVVAVRGAALTFIDCVLALTEGRPRAEWPRRILPVSRSGALLLAKPAVPMRADLAELLARHAAQLPGLLADAAAPFEAATRATRAAAAELLTSQGQAHQEAVAAVDAALTTGFDPDLAPQGRARAALQRSNLLAEQDHASSPSWVLGRAWAALYAPMVAGLAHRSPETVEWRRFSAASAVLERFTYGPPLPNARRLEALICQHDGPHASCTAPVCLEWLERGVGIAEGITGVGDDERPDVVVDAVLPPPGAQTARTPLVDALMVDGWVRTAMPRRGLEVTPHAQCVGRDGSLTPGLSAIGRLTEDVVIGHDTLSVRMHDEIERWAARLASELEA